MINNQNLLELINIFRNGTSDNKLIKSIIDNYQKYPLYIIKYVTIYFPVQIAEHIVNYIVMTNERKCELIDCVLQAHDVKLCEISLLKDFVCKNECGCYSRKYWRYMYINFLNVLKKNPAHFLFSYKMYDCFTTLVSRTDVIDISLHRFIESLSLNPKNWKIIIQFIRDVGLYSSEYGDIIFSMRDLILENDKLDKNNKNTHISEFQNRAMLGTVLRRYNDMQKNMSKITDNIFITDINGAGNVSILKDKNIQYVITLTKRSIFKISGISYTQIMIDDLATVNFISTTISTVEQVIEYIKNNKIVLVHCYKGMSRSVSFVILTLVKQGLSFQDAYDLVKKQRTIIDPNPEFLRQINDFIDKHNKILLN
jgi:hypothetical protein